MARSFRSVNDFLTTFEVREVIHLSERHYNKSIGYLQKRNAPMASTFVVEPNASFMPILYSVHTAIEKYETDIHGWLRDIQDNMTFLLPCRMPDQWHGILWTSGQLYDCDEFVVVLNKYGAGDQFKVSTIFPCREIFEHLIEIKEGSNL